MKKNKINRRNFLKTSSVGSLAALGAGLIPSEAVSAINNVEPMKIMKIEIVKDFMFEGRSLPWLWVRLYTNNGIVGVGESYYCPGAMIGLLKERGRNHNMAELLIGKDPREIEKFFKESLRIGWGGSGGTDMRLRSAINMAQWDILGKACGLPLYQLLGGKSQEKLRVYNTAISLNNMHMKTDAEKITRFLLDRGIKAMKVWPYDEVAIKNNGNYISPNEREQCLDWFKRIRDTAGDEMDIAIEFHSRWNLPCSLKIAESLEPYNIMWLEDMMRPDNMQSYAVLARETSIPICVSERLATRYQFREMLESKAVDVIMFDIAWCGGISEAKKIADLADTYYIPIATHNMGGPPLWASSLHLGTAVTNVFITESTYRNYTDVYPYFITNTPVPDDEGFVTVPEEPGLGIEFRTEPFENGDVTVETIAEI